MASFGWTLSDTSEPSRTRLDQLRKNVLRSSENRLERRASLPSVIDTDSCLGSELPSITSEESYSECSFAELRALRNLNTTANRLSNACAVGRSTHHVTAELREIQTDLLTMAERLGHLTAVLRSSKQRSESVVDFSELNEETMCDLVYRVLKQTCQLHLAKQEGVDISLIV